MARNKYPEETVEKILDIATKLFMEKGYDNTSIQDIINNLGGLSKGAIYHHFKSKEDIFNAVGDRYNEQLIDELGKIRDAQNILGIEKLRKLFSLSLSAPDRDLVYTVAPDYLKNPRLLSRQIQEIFYIIAPKFIEPIIKEGIKDGTIKTQYPKQVAEVIMMMTNIWLNPVVIKADTDEMINRIEVYDSILKGFGINLLDDKMKYQYVHYCNIFKNQHK